MRDILWGAAIAVAVMLIFHASRSHHDRRGGPYPPPPQDAWFQQQVLGPSASSPVVVKFGAAWCGPCRAMESQLDRVAETLANRVRVVRVDVDQQRELSEHYQISPIPHTLLVAEGKVVDDRIGYLSAMELLDWVRPWLK